MKWVTSQTKARTMRYRERERRKMALMASRLYNWPNPGSRRERTSAVHGLCPRRAPASVPGAVRPPAGGICWGPAWGIGVPGAGQGTDGYTNGCGFCGEGAYTGVADGPAG